MKASIIFTAALFFTTTLVQIACYAGEDYEEVNYNSLVNELNQKKNSYSNPFSDPFDSNKIHAGFGLIGSMLNTEDGGHRGTKYQNGFQLSMGIDLFSPQWASEIAVRNFGQTRSGTEIRSLREFDLKMMRRDLLAEGVGYRAGVGVGNRYLKISDDNNDVSVNDSTPSMVFFGGLDMYANKSFSLGIETDYHTALVGTTADKSSLDVTVRLDTYF